MRHGARAGPLAATMMLLSMLASRDPAAQEQGLRLGTWAGEVELGYGADQQQTHSEGAPVSEFTHRRLRERIGIRNQGFSILDPRLITGSLGLTFDWFQDHDRTNGTDTSRQGNLNGYAFDTTFFGGMPYNATIYANQSQNFQTQPFGGRIETKYENHGATLRLREDSFLREEWGVPYFNANLNTYKEHIQETTTGPGQIFRRDELRDVLAFDAHKGFTTSDLDFRYELNNLDNIAYPPGTFQTETGLLSYSLDFGPDLNRRWDSRLFRSTRTGLSPTKYYNADERVRIDHYKNLFTDYRYLRNRIETQEGTTDTQNVIFQVQHELYSSLTTHALASTMHEQLPTGTRSNYAGQLDFNYQRSVPTGRVFARVGGRHQVDTSNLSSSQINVVDEPHAAPNPLAPGVGFLLNQAFVISSTIVMVDTRGGARLPTTAGIDYEIVPEGNLVRIVPLLGSAVIQPGDPLAVSYAYELDPSSKYSTDAYWLNAGVDFRWIAFSLGHEQYDQTLLSGTSSQFLEDRHKDTAQLDLRGAWKTLQGQASAAFTRYDATHLAYTQRRFTELVWFRPGSDLVLALNAEESYTDYTLPERESDNLSLRLTLDWFAPGGWTTTTLLGRRILRDSLLPTELVTEASLRARLTYGKLEIVGVVAADDRTRGTFQTVDRRMDLKIVRRF